MKTKPIPIIKTFLKIEDFVTSKKKTKALQSKIEKEVGVALKYSKLATTLPRYADRVRMRQKSIKILENVLKKIEKETAK